MQRYCSPDSSILEVWALNEILMTLQQIVARHFFLYGRCLYGRCLYGKKFVNFLPPEIVQTDGTIRCKGTGEKPHDPQVHKRILKKIRQDIMSNTPNPTTAVWGTMRTTDPGWQQDLCVLPRVPRQTHTDLIQEGISCTLLCFLFVDRDN